MNNILRKIAFGFMIIFVLHNMESQDVEAVLSSPPLVSNGGINMSHILNFTNDSIKNNDTYSFYLSGNFNSSLFSIVNLPFSFSYTNNKAIANMPQPFNRISISPSYKWVYTHIGYSSMSFSPYTLSGHEFLGGGIELKPENGLRFSAMYGRLRKEALPDTTGILPCYRRMGGGFLLGYEKKKINISINMFKANDEPNDLITNNDFLENNLMMPEENLATSINLNTVFDNGFSFGGEYGFSQITKNTLGNENKINTTNHRSKHHAVKMLISQSTKLGKIGATYEYVSPNYITFGSYYFVNDFENITANLSTILFNKINIAADVGLQKDDLENQKANKTKRSIYSATISAPITERGSINFSNSNMQSYTHIKDIFDEVSTTNQYQNLDTLSFTQISNTSTLSGNYKIINREKQQQSLSLSFMFQKASEEQAHDVKYVGTEIYNGMISHSFIYNPIKLTINSTINYNESKGLETKMDIYSANINISKTFIDKIRLGLTSTYSTTYNFREKYGEIINIRLNGAYTFKNRHSFNMSFANIHNTTQRGHKTNLSANLSYSYLFGIKLLRENKKIKFEGEF